MVGRSVNDALCLRDGAALSSSSLPSSSLPSSSFSVSPESIVGCGNLFRSKISVLSNLKIDDEEHFTNIENMKK